MRNFRPFVARLLLAIVFVSAGTSFVHADPCDKDRITTCGDITAGDGKVHDCLIGRSDKVAPECAQAVTRADALASAAVTACQPEVQRWCAQYTGSGSAAVLQCLKDHRHDIGDACKSKYRQFKAYGFDIRS